MPNPPDPRMIRGSVRAIYNTLTDTLPRPILWPKGDLPSLPNTAVCYLVADGLASRSHPDSKDSSYIPWLTFLQNNLNHRDFNRFRRGFSYYERRFRYAPADTN